MFVKGSSGVYPIRAVAPWIILFQSSQISLTLWIPASLAHVAATVNVPNPIKQEQVLLFLCLVQAPHSIETCRSQR